MKHLQNLLLLFALSLITISCSKDDDDTSLTEADLIGMWEMTEFYTEDGKITGTFEGIPAVATFTITGSNFDSSFTFANNPKKVTISGGFTITSSLNFLGKIHEESINPDTDDEENMPWSLNDNVLSIDTDKFEIVSFDNNTLRLLYTESPPYFSLIDIEEGEVTGSLYLTLEKQ